MSNPLRIYCARYLAPVTILQDYPKLALLGSHLGQVAGAMIEALRPFLCRCLGRRSHVIANKIMRNISWLLTYPRW
jgi:hypothetical protein